MNREGILGVIGDIIANETDQLVLVCLFHFYFSLSLFTSSTLYADCYTDAIVFYGATVETYDEKSTSPDTGYYREYS